MKVKIFAAIFVMCGFLYNLVGLHAQQSSPQAAAQTLTANAPAVVNINNGQRVQLRFTAPSAGTYWFESSNNGTLDPVAYSAASGTEKIDDDGGEGSNFRFMRDLRSGEVFTFFAGCFNNRGTGSYTVIVQTIQPVSFTANAPAAVTINNGRRVQLSFTAPSAGTYTIESTNSETLDPVAFSAASGTEKIDDDGGEGNNFRFTQELRAGEVITFFAGCFNDRGTGSYSVNLFTAYDLEQRILAFEQRVFELTNIERVNHGLPPLIRHETLAVAARAHSLDLMLNNLGTHTGSGHTGSDGSTASQRMVRAGITNGRFYGENISYGSTTPEEVVEGWMNSPGHRENILDTDFTHLGVGLTWRPEGSSARFRIYIVQNFCSFL